MRIEQKIVDFLPSNIIFNLYVHIIASAFTHWSPPCPACVPYSEKACIVATIFNGYQIANYEKTGYNFEGPWSYKGCKVYTSGTYGGYAFYGTGGTVEEMQSPLADGLRPEGYDCNHM